MRSLIIRFLSAAAAFSVTATTATPSLAQEPHVIQASAPATLDAASAKSFVQWIYSHYRYPDGARWREQNEWSPLDLRTAATIYAPGTLTLLRQNDALTRSSKYEGAMDYDPFCGCQDVMSAEWFVSARLTGLTTATATITAREPGSSAPPSDPVTLSLVAVGGRWRVYDLRAKDLPSLRQAYMNDSHAKAAEALRPSR